MPYGDNCIVKLHCVAFTFREYNNGEKYRVCTQECKDDSVVFSIIYRVKEVRGIYYASCAARDFLTLAFYNSYKNILVPQVALFNEFFLVADFNCNRLGRKMCLLY